MIKLGEYLLEQGKKIRIDGTHDCCTMPADWVVSQGYADPMAKWRGTYASENEAIYLIDAAGGLVSLFEEGFSSVGIKRRIGDLQEGDIGVVCIQGCEAGAIFAGKRWALVAPRGLALASFSDADISATWAVERG